MKVLAATPASLHQPICIASFAPRGDAAWGQPSFWGSRRMSLGSGEGQGTLAGEMRWSAGPHETEAGFPLASPGSSHHLPLPALTLQ